MDNEDLKYIRLMRSGEWEPVIDQFAELQPGDIVKVFQKNVQLWPFAVIEHPVVGDGGFGWQAHICRTLLEAHIMARPVTAMHFGAGLR
jgi:hypothetical protein